MNQKIRNQCLSLLLQDPETNEDLVCSSDLKTNSDGSYSFRVRNKAGVETEHTIKTVEVS